MIGPGRPSVVAVGGLGRAAAGAGVCRSEAGHIVVELLRAIRGVPQKLAAALEGRRLAVDVVLTGVGGGRFLLLFAPEGVVYRFDEDACRRGAFRPHVTLRGRPEEVAAVVLGDVDTAAAVFAGTLRLHVERIDDLLPHYPQVVHLVADELARLIRH